MIHKFVEYLPENLEEGTIYVSMTFGIVAHKCCCGCGKEVITPLSPTDWELTFDGESISLYPSIGNWNSECKSHYWIRNSRVEWARVWSRARISAARNRERKEKEIYYLEKDAEPSKSEQKRKFWLKIIKKGEKS
ncbi:MAG: DUF6527 family protein [Thermoleophilia bacterium]